MVDEIFILLISLMLEVNHEIEDWLPLEGAAQFEEIRAFEEADFRDDFEVVLHAGDVFHLEDEPGVELIELRLVGGAMPAAALKTPRETSADSTNFASKAV
jgi:hypothetical protein